MITTKTHLYLTGTFVANPDKVMEPGILIPGRTWNGAFPKDNCLSYEDSSGHKFSVPATDCLEFLSWLYDVAELERDATTNVESEDISLYSYWIKWFSFRRLKKTFENVAEILRQDFCILSVCITSILVRDSEIARNVTKFCSPKILDEVLAGTGF